MSHLQLEAKLQRNYARPLGAPVPQDQLHIELHFQVHDSISEATRLDRRPSPAHMERRRKRRSRRIQQSAGIGSLKIWRLFSLAF